MYSNSILSFLVLLSVLNTYSLPTITLYKAIQHSEIPKCPALRGAMQNSTEPDYLKGCGYPLDSKSNDVGMIRCSLYLSQFNLLCESSMPNVPPDFLNDKDVQYNSMLNDPCAIFAMPVMINNSSNIDTFIVEKCKTICTNIRTDQIDVICTAASYIRIIAIKWVKLNMNTSKTVNIKVDKGSQTPSAVPIVPQDINKLALSEKVALLPENTNLHSQMAPLTAALSTGTTGSAGTQLLADTAKLVEHAINKNENEDISKSNVNGDTTIISKEIEAKLMIEQKPPPESISANTKLKSNEVIVNSQIFLPKKTIPLMEEEEEKSENSATLQNIIVEKSTTVTKTDNSVVNNKEILQNTALASDYPEKGIDIDSPENNLPIVVETNVDTIAKHHGLTENEDEDNISHNMYRDDRTAEDNSYFFTYFMMLCVVFIFAYVGYHNKQKIIAIVVEGRRGSSAGGRGGRSRGGRRPNSANYHKLDSNLEEAVSSNTATKNSSKVIY